MASWLSVQKVAFLCVAVVLCLVVASVGSGPAEAAMEGVEQVLLESPVGGWVTALPDGRLMQWWTEDKPDSKDETGSTQLAFARYSSDLGYTWTEKEFLFEFPRSEGKCRFSRDACGIVLVDADGAWHIFGMYWCHWSWEKFAGKSLVFHVMSADGGKTWSDVVFCDSGVQYNGIQSAIQLSTGRILAPLWHAREDVHHFGTLCSISDDRGKTWRRGGTMYGEVTTDETPMVELMDGRVWALCRNGSGHQYEAYSADGGETWYDLRPSRFVAPSSPAALKRLADGRIMVVWNNSQKPKHVFNRLVLAAAISDDDGKTWHGYREIARTSGVEGPKGWVCYPWITQANDETVIVTYGTAGFKANILHVDPDWLMQTALHENFSEGLDNWITMHTEGAELVAHPRWGNRQVLALRKPNAEVASGASLNFPFGEKGHLMIRLRLEPGFQGARICLNDHFTWPYYAEDGRFGISIAPDGRVSVGTAQNQFTPTQTTLEVGKWHRLGFDWDCATGSCQLSIDYQEVADLPQLSPAAGVCYLRLWSAAEQTDAAGMLVESVTTVAKP